MRNSARLFAASALFVSASFGAAFAAPGDGDYYAGINRAPAYEGAGSARMGGSVPTIVPGGESAYYEGIDRRPSVDVMSTGSISNGAAPMIKLDSGDYYPGL